MRLRLLERFLLESAAVFLALLFLGGLLSIRYGSPLPTLPLAVIAVLLLAILFRAGLPEEEGGRPRIVRRPPRVH